MTLLARALVPACYVALLLVVARLFPASRGREATTSRPAVPLAVAGILTVGAATMALYLAEGAAGLPVFAGGAAGAGWLAGPTGGYLLGFVPAALLVGALDGAAPWWCTDTAMPVAQLGCAPPDVRDTTFYADPRLGRDAPTEVEPRQMVATLREVFAGG